jgi:serine/threonine protein kinase
MTEAVHYMHTEAFMMHRDLHADHFIFHNGKCILSDFKSSIHLGKHGYTSLGTLGPLRARTACAPEVLFEKFYTYNADIWHLGCTMFWMAS